MLNIVSATIGTALVYGVAWAIPFWVFGLGAFESMAVVAFGDAVISAFIESYRHVEDD